MTREIDTAKLRDLLSGCRYGRQIHYVEETPSTQDTAVQLIRGGAEEGLLVLAESQTSGRGRLGRAWFSPPGTGIYMSLVVQPKVPHRYVPQLTIVAATALCRVLRRLTQLDIRLKWPNDLYVSDRKICGILIESLAEAGPARFILGTGLSVNIRQEQFPDWLQDKATSLLAASGRSWEREVIIAHYLIELEELISLYVEEGFSVFRTIWETYAWQPGYPIEITTPQGKIKGDQHAIDEQGALVVKLEDGSLITVYAGEITTANS